MPGPVITVIHEPWMSFGSATVANRNLLESMASLTRSDHFLTQGPLQDHAYCQQFIHMASAQHTLHHRTLHLTTVLKKSCPALKLLKYMDMSIFSSSVMHWFAFVKWNRWINYIIIIIIFLNKNALKYNYFKNIYAHHRRYGFIYDIFNRWENFRVNKVRDVRVLI